MARLTYNLISKFINTIIYIHDSVYYIQMLIFIYFSPSRGNPYKPLVCKHKPIITSLL